MSRKSRSSSSSGQRGSLTCPRCALAHSVEERFCASCGMPLVYTGHAAEPDRGEAHSRARKISPEYTRGELVRVAGGRNQAEAELIQNLLLEEGIPSLLKRTAGFDVPDYLAGGPRDVLVAESAVAAARAMLLEADLAPAERAGRASARSPLLTIAVILAVVAAAVLVVYAAWLVLPPAR